MNFRSSVGLAACALMLAAGFAAAALAEDAAAPAAQQAPAADAAKNLEACLAETGDYAANGKLVTYVIGLENKCDKRLKCTIDAYVVGAKGPTSGHATMILDPASSGAAAKQSYVMKVKAFGGTAQVSRACKIL